MHTSSTKIPQAEKISTIISALKSADKDYHASGIQALRHQSFMVVSLFD